MKGSGLSIRGRPLGPALAVCTCLCFAACLSEEDGTVPNGKVPNGCECLPGAAHCPASSEDNRVQTARVAGSFMVHDNPRIQPMRQRGA